MNVTIKSGPEGTKVTGPNGEDFGRMITEVRFKAAANEISRAEMVFGMVDMDAEGVPGCMIAGHNGKVIRKIIYEDGTEQEFQP